MGMPSLEGLWSGLGIFNHWKDRKIRVTDIDN